MKAYRGRYNSVHSQPRHYMVVNGKLHAPADLPQEKPVPIEKEAGWVPETIRTFGRF